MKLNPEPFNKIAKGTKTIELRLYDNKRRAISLGDTIIFIREPERTQQLMARVVGLLHYSSFRDLIYDFPAECFGGSDSAEVLDGMRKYYSQQDEQRYGVLGIKIELVG